MKTTEVEVIRGLDFEQYLAIDATNNSRMKLLDRSPLHYLKNPSTKTTAAMSLGTMTHTAVLEPSEFLNRYSKLPPGVKYDKRTKAFKEHVALLGPGVDVVRSGDYERALEIAHHIHSDPMLERLFGRDCESELTILWVDPETGIRCKVRVDKFCPQDGFVDLKSTVDCSVAQFPWFAKRYGYVRQMAFYRRGIMAAIDAGLLKCERPGVPAYVLAAETGPVRAHALYVIPDAEITHFDSEVSRHLHTIRECATTGKWPGPGGEAPIPLEYPGALDYEDEPDDDGVSEDWGE